MPLTDWKEFFERVEAGWEGRPAPPSLQTHPGLLPDYSKGGAPRRRGQTPMLKPIPWPRQLVAKPWEHLSKIQPTLERTIGLPKERPMQSWETSHKTEWPANPIDLDVRDMQLLHCGGRGYFSKYVHEARMKGVDLDAKGHIYGPLRGVGGNDAGE